MTALILGATSDMAIALSRYLASKGYNLQLVARDITHTDNLKKDIEIKYKVSVQTLVFDAVAFETHEAFYQSLSVRPDLAVVVFGYLGSHEKAMHNWSECRAIMEANYCGAVSILNIIANDFEKQQSGTIVGISSVAGDRGRMSNYIYGSAKAGLTTYLSGLRNRLFHAGVHVITVKPGFVQTKMTEDLDLPKLITANPEQVANAIYKGVLKRKNVIYVLSIWSIIMLVIKSIPESIFKKLRL